SRKLLDEYGQYIIIKTSTAGMGFKIDEIVQAWNEMYDAKRWQIGVPSFRLEPLFRRRSPKLHDILENVFSGPQ
ncbi:predicted protein, partial [Arabidopsis lyrata subsp. lyrata]